MAALIAGGRVAPGKVCVAEIAEEKRALLNARHGVNVAGDAAEVPDAASVVFLCVKPQDLDAVLARIAGRVTDAHLLVSVAAGKRLAGLERLLPRGRVARVMPNLAALVGQSMSVFCLGRRAAPDDRAVLTELLSCFGRALELPETQFDAVTALSGSGPAFFAFFMQAVAEAGARLGLAPADAGLLSVQTMLGAAVLLARGELNAQALIEAVSSRKGTTVAGREVLEHSDLKDLVYRTLEAAARRSAELSG